MKKRTVFGIVLIVWCVLCTLSVLQVWNVLNNHRQNERLIDDVRRNPRTPGLAYDDSEIISRKRMIGTVMTGPGEFHRASTFSGGDIYAFAVEIEEGYFLEREKKYRNVLFEAPPAFREMERLYDMMKNENE